MSLKFAEDSNKTHLSVVICGHVDAGKSTTTGRLMFELGGLDERSMEKLKKEAEELGKGSFAFAFFMDRNKDERERGVTIACTTKEFYTEKYHYTIIDAPGHRDFIKNMITGASQADVACLMVPADGNFTASIAKGNPKQGIIQGQTRQHARLINLLGVKQLIVCINKMDAKAPGYKQGYDQDRYTEIKNEVTSTLAKVGWKKDFIAKSVPIIPISGWHGDNLLEESSNLAWWKGVDVVNTAGDKIHVHTLLQALNDFVLPPSRNLDSDIRMPVSGVYKIKGVGDVISGCIEQGLVTKGLDVKFVPSHQEKMPCKGKVFSIEMHHKNVEKAPAGFNVGLNVKNLSKENMPKVGDVMVLASDSALGPVKNFTAQVQILDHPGQLKVGYCPIAFVRTGRAPVRLEEIKWKMGKETGGKKAPSPAYVKAGEVGEVVFAPKQPFTCEGFKKCEGLGRLAIMEGNGVVMLGKITKVEYN